MPPQDTRQKTLNPEDAVAIPNDLVDKYLPLFKNKKQLLAVMDLIRQSYLAGLTIGRNGTTFHRG